MTVGALMASAVMTSAQKPDKTGSGKVANAKKTVVVGKLDHYSSVTMAKNMNMTLVMGEKQQVSITAEPTVAKAVTCEVIGGHLYIGAEKFKYKKSARIYVTVTVDSTLCEVNGTLGGNIRSEGALQLENLRVNTGYGTSAHILGYIGDQITINAESNAKVEIYGKARRTHIEAHKQSDVVMKNMQSQETTVEVDEESKVDVSATETLSLTVDRSSMARYHAPGAEVSVKSETSTNTTSY